MPTNLINQIDEDENKWRQTAGALSGCYLEGTIAVLECIVCPPESSGGLSPHCYQGQSPFSHHSMFFQSGHCLLAFFRQ